MSDGSHMTPLMWAGFHGRPANVQLLKQKGGGTLLIHVHVISRNFCYFLFLPFSISLFISDTGLVDCGGMRAIHWSVKSRDLKTLQVSTTSSQNLPNH